MLNYLEQGINKMCNSNKVKSNPIREVATINSINKLDSIGDSILRIEGKIATMENRLNILEMARCNLTQGQLN